MSNLYNYYKNEGKLKLAKELGFKNLQALPKLIKVVINCGLGEALVNKKALDAMSSQLAKISGQKSLITYARRDISSFKLRKGEPIGLKITLRGKRMYNFVEKLAKIVLPRIRDFRGLALSGFDGFGGYTLGFKEQIVFPEIEYSEIDKIRGLEITFVSDSQNPEQLRKLMEILGFPFKKVKDN